MRMMVLIFTSLLVSCASTPSHRNLTDTMDLIEAAADVAPKGIKGRYVFNIKATGTQRQLIFLNTELDYRDQRCVTIALTPQVAYELAQQYGQPPEDFFLNKAIKVKGSAKRVRIDIYAEGKSTGKYYYQTHIPISHTSQIDVLE